MHRRNPLHWFLKKNLRKRRKVVQRAAKAQIAPETLDKVTQV